MNIKKAVVVGGSGFIGSHVADHLSDAGYKVVIYDRCQSNRLLNDQEMVVGDISEKEKFLSHSLCPANCGKIKPIQIGLFPYVRQSTLSKPGV